MSPNHLIGFAAAATVALLAACAGQQRQTTATASTPAPEKVNIVKGEEPATSELALLMREMVVFADSTRLRVAQGRDLLPFPEQFLRLKTAEATPGMKDAQVFDPFAHAWQYHLEALYKAPQPERAGVFNTLVQTCAGCHTTMCPGPLVKINKLSLPTP
ncbi:MAG TPA: hypothetical protein PLV70_10805 [Flavobacteriales bacterium]|nr:hypothetical protein [Flavobacteriales bacterium]HRN35626.1 hypothetical protein [Flavobacteriales bacterium]HRO38980.1 hypothetical protein [Flavobacteriales bacterium]HRP81459.1 hypothetical protein [Flavobacteriales bacterium]HRQ85592.1 hypothetical protein [Flavobacteriales bacterium]